MNGRGQHILGAGGAGATRLAAAALLAACALAAGAQDLIEVPSGQPVTFHDRFLDENGDMGPVARFRFVAPQIARDGGTVTFAMAEADMAHLCDAYALPRLPELGGEAVQIVVTLMDRPVPFGEPDPEATQFFEAYRPVDGRCEWEGF